MKKTASKLYIFYVVIMLLALGAIIAALCLFDYKFDVTFEQMWQNNTIALCLAGAFVLINVIIILSAIILRIKNDALTRGEVKLGFMVTAVIILETVLCVPIFLIWLVQLIQDAVARRKRESI